MQEVQGKSKKGLILAEALLLLFADRFSNSFLLWLRLPWKRNSSCTPPIITPGRHFTFIIKTFIHFPHFVSRGRQLTLWRSKAVRRHFFSMSLFGSGNQLFNIAAVTVFLWVIFAIVTCLGNVTVTETAEECYWKSMVKGGLDGHDDHSSLSWFLQSPHDSNSIPEYRKDLPVVSGILDFGIGNSAQGIRNPTNDWNRERVRNPVPEIPWITLCGAKSSSGCLETSGRGYRIDRREDDCKRDEFLGKTFLCSSPIPLEFSWD